MPTLKVLIGLLVYWFIGLLVVMQYFIKPLQFTSLIR